MQIVPTLNFGGNCREAIQMYASHFEIALSLAVYVAGQVDSL